MYLGYCKKHKKDLIPAGKNLVTCPDCKKEWDQEKAWLPHRYRALKGNKDNYTKGCLEE